jgi:hypothetical protein
MWRPLIGGRSADWEIHFGSVDRGQQMIWALFLDRTVQGKSSSSAGAQGKGTAWQQVAGAWSETTLRWLRFDGEQQRRRGHGELGGGDIHGEGGGAWWHRMAVAEGCAAQCGGAQR